jgi:hypothetical protein
MSSTTIRTAIVPTDVDGVLRVFTVGRPTEITADVRRAARTAAQREHGGVMVGTTPAPVPATFRGEKGLGWTFTPVAKSTKPAEVLDAEVTRANSDMPSTRKGKGKGGKGKGKGTTVGESAAAMLAALPDGPERTLLASLLGTVSTAAPAVPAAPKDRPRFLGKNPDATCEACQDYGVVRAAGARKGGAYKTANGAADATSRGNSVPCTAAVHSRKGKGKRSA